jgi:hypothetical protein
LAAGCGSPAMVRDRCDDTHPDRQQCQRKACASRFDDLTGTVFAGTTSRCVWVLCLSFMGLSQQIARELGLCGSEMEARMDQLCRGLAVKKLPMGLTGEVPIDEVDVVPGHKGEPDAIAKKGGSDNVASWQARRSAACRSRGSKGRLS